MKGLLLIGIVLMVLGAVGLIYGGITYTKDKETADLGPLSVSVEDKETLAMHPALGGLILVGGIVVTAIATKKK